MRPFNIKYLYYNVCTYTYKIIENECNRSGYIDFIEILILMDTYLFGDKNKLQLFSCNLFGVVYSQNELCVHKVFISIIKLVLIYIFILYAKQNAKCKSKKTTKKTKKKSNKTKKNQVHYV